MHPINVSFQNVLKDFCNKSAKIHDKMNANRCTVERLLLVK